LFLSVVQAWLMVVFNCRRTGEMTSRTLEKNSEMAFLLFLAMSDRKVSFYDDVSVKKTIFE
jgi:hypothetical protein